MKHDAWLDVTTKDDSEQRWMRIIGQLPNAVLLDYPRNYTGKPRLRPLEGRGWGEVRQGGGRSASSANVG